MDLTNEKLDTYFELNNNLSKELGLSYEIDDFRNCYWYCSDSSIFWSYVEDTTREDLEDGEEFEYCEDVYGTSVTRKEKFTGITFYDGCGNKVSGIFDNDNEIKDYEEW